MSDDRKSEAEPCGAPWGIAWIIGVLAVCVGAAKLGAWLS